MDLQPNKTDGIYLPITNTRISASEWNQLVGSCMAFITEAGLTPDASDNEQFLNAFKTIAAGLEIVGANTNLSNLTATGEARFTTKANTDLSNVPSSKGILVESYVNGTSGYRIYSDGWCEQWGQISLNQSVSGGAYNVASVTFLKPFANTFYSVATNSFHDRFNTGSNSKSTSSMTVYYVNDSSNTFTISAVGWLANGYIS